MPSGHRAARVTFIANRDLVQTELAAGWSVKAVYERNPTQLAGISYRQFLRYVNDMRSPQPATPQPAQPPPVPPPTPEPVSASNPRTFHHPNNIPPSRHVKLFGTKSD